MSSLPQDHWPDATIPLLRDPYRHILTRTRSLGTKGFRSRFLGSPAVFVTGADAARFFFGQAGFTREGAAPALARDVLFGRGGVQTLDGSAHRHRKSLFLGILGPETCRSVVEARFVETFRACLSDTDGETGVLEVTKRALARTALDWAGVPVDPKDMDATADRLANLFLHAGSGPVGQTKGRIARRVLESDLGSIIDSIRAGSFDPGPEAPASAISRWQDPQGALLPRDVAAVELLNVLRPIVAVAVYFVFLAHAFARYPSAQERIAQEAAFRNAFVQEVRRYYPFFPATAAIATEDVCWREDTIAAGTRVVMDLFGTNREAERWTDPDRFVPDRFLDWRGNAFSLIPQGGGEHAETHRCPGEWLTIGLMERFADMLASDEIRIARAGSAPDYSALPALPVEEVTIRPTA